MRTRVYAALVFTCLALAPAAPAGPITRTITTINAGRAATAGDPSTNVPDGAISGATRGAIVGGIAGGIAGFFGLVKKVSSKRGRDEETSNEGREGRPYF